MLKKFIVFIGAVLLPGCSTTEEGIFGPIIGIDTPSAVMKGRAAIILNQIRWRFGDRSKFGYQHQVWPN